MNSGTPQLVSDDGRAIQLVGRIVTFGSDADCTVVVQDKKVPKRAAHALYSGGTYTIEPLSHKSGLSVNDKRVKESHSLKDQDLIDLFGHQFTYVDTAKGEESVGGTVDFSLLQSMLGSMVSLMQNRSSDVIPELVASVARMLQCDAARLVREEGDQISTIARFPDTAGLERFSTSAIDWAREAGEAVLSQLTDWLEPSETETSLQRNAIGSVLCAPLIQGEEIIGYLYLDRIHTGEPFTEYDRKLCNTVVPLFAEILTTRSELQKQRDTIKRLQESGQGDDGLVFESTPMTDLFEQAQTFAATDSPVVIRGETGTGKERLARYIHQHSTRASSPYKAINCGAIPENLIESELFGHEKAAFTGASQRKIGILEAADGGTIFLDEIGELPLQLQVKLLRFLQESEIQRVGSTDPVKLNIRVITATHRNLEDDVANGLFRQDLFYRINVLVLKLPPLRERGSDIVLLAHYFAKQYCEQFGLPLKSFSALAVNHLKEYRWPGNIREMENVIQRAVLTTPGSTILPEMLSVTGSVTVQNVLPDTAVTLDQGLKGVREAAEKEAIVRALEFCGGNVSQSSKKLQIDRKWLMKKMKEFDIVADDFR